MTVGLTQAQVARRAGASQTMVSAVERGTAEASLDVLCRMAAACGLDLVAKLYPAERLRLRDSGQLGVAHAIASVAHSSWRTRLEVPVGADDLRAADMLLERPDDLNEIEIETLAYDLQAQYRGAQLKRQALSAHLGRPVNLIIAMPDRTSIKQALVAHQALVRQVLPVPSREIWHAIREGRPVGGDGILFVRTRSPRRATDGDLRIASGRDVG